MSTRCNIIVKDEYESIIFYKHSDGYPEGTMPILERFLGYVKEGKLRDNASQSSGWLIIIGAEEYGQSLRNLVLDKEPRWLGLEWKVGAIEPTTQIAGDAEYVYIVDLVKKEISVEEV